jgi:hypothetical protein
MTRSRTLSALSVALGAASVALALAPTDASAQANCQWYATTALKQQQENVRLACGFKGDAWSSDLREHTRWCASVSPDAWRNAAKDRDKQLADCAAKKR